MGAAGAIACRRHAEHAGRFLVETPARIEAGVVDRRRDAGAVFQALADPGGAVRCGIVLRRQPGDGLEDAVEITGAAAGGISQLSKRRFFLALFDPAAGIGDHRRIAGLERRTIRIAAPARAKAGRPGLIQRAVQLHIPGLARRDGQEGRQ